DIPLTRNSGMTGDIPLTRECAFGISGITRPTRSSQLVARSSELAARSSQFETRNSQLPFYV
ncbi:MAG: hypothetical protein WD356_07995, partial [Pseudomonadales bacterium]